MSRQLLQRHFPTKGDLYRSLLDRHREGLLAIVVAATPSGPSADRPLGAVARAWFGYVGEHPFVAAFLFDDATGDPENARLHRQMREGARRAVQQLLAEHLPADTPSAQLEIWAEMVRSSAVGLARWHAAHPRLTTDEIAEVATETWLRALRPD